MGTRENLSSATSTHTVLSGLSRRKFLQSITALAAASASPIPVSAATRARPLVGAIRWDAWYAPGSVPTEAVKRTLSPAKYQWQLPFFANVSGENISLPSISQGIIDLEIDHAAYMGIDYWAFVAYGQDDPMSAPLQFYLKSASRQKVRFCMFTELERWGTKARPSSLIAEHLALMASDTYLRVYGNRPLYFLGFITAQKAIDRWGSLSGLKAQISLFRSQAVSVGLGNPYFVVAGSSRDADTWAPYLDGDAVSAYVIADSRTTGQYAALAQLAENGWQILGTTGLPVVPTVMAGWDRRPRVENPVPWEPNQKPGAGLEYYFEMPTPVELSSHLRRAISFAQQSTAYRRAPAVLIYAWNEYDEGGWLTPTIPCERQHSEAIHQVLATRSQFLPGCAVPK